MLLREEGVLWAERAGVGVPLGGPGWVCRQLPPRGGAGQAWAPWDGRTHSPSPGRSRGSGLVWAEDQLEAERRPAVRGGGCG